MKIRLVVLVLTFLQLSSYAQESFTGRKGTKFFPGHFDVVLTVENDTLQYELFNHWYSSSYATLRDLSITLHQLDQFNQNNDSIKITMQRGKIKLIDKKYRLSKKIKHSKLCAPATTMRKIVFAYTLSEQANIRHFELYNQEDLQLNEEEFNQKVLDNLKEKTKQ